jgi:putative transposase
MTRQLRIYVPNASVHVIHRGNNRTAVFLDDTDRHVFLRFLRRASDRHSLSIHGFVLMDTHYHLVATPTDERSLPRAMQELGVRYVRYFNRKYERIGTLWNSRYRGLLIADERYWFTCLQYVEHNPVKAGMVAAPEAYAWSSYRRHAFGEGFPWLTEHHLYIRLGPTPAARQDAYRALCRTPVAEEDIIDQRLA